MEIEILLLPDGKTDFSRPKTKVIPTGPVVPGVKRNLGMDMASGEYVAFLDSDAYPRKDWLTNAIRHLQREEVIGVGGPGVTPPEDGPLQKAGGMVYESPLMGGLAKRYSEKGVVESADIHSCNLIVKKAALTGVRWDEKYWPGEDTLFCRDILAKNKGILLEAGDVLIYHHRRPLFRRHLKQVSAFGLHRGFFVKKFPENSRKLVYYMPSLMVIGTLSVVTLSLIVPILGFLLVVALAGYLVGAAIPARGRLRLLPLVFLGLIVTHAVYGIQFLRGLTRKELSR
jgi:glycosyltransferase involved in cell wall biosynthesis